jgi:hypothetical protein
MSEALAFAESKGRQAVRAVRLPYNYFVVTRPGAAGASPRRVQIGVDEDQLVRRAARINT